MRSKLERDVLVLKTYALVASLVCLALVTTGLGPSAPERTRFSEIDVERINVVEADGGLRLVISNRERQHPGVVDGVATPRPQGRPPGILFFNHQGNEAGGLLVGENGGQGHALSLTFDKSRSPHRAARRRGRSGRLDASAGSCGALTGWSGVLKMAA